MKKIMTGAVLISAIVIYSCASQAKQAKQTTRDLERLLPPVPPSFSHADSIRLIQNWTIGMRLYRNNCSACHGVFGKNKDSATDFSEQQFDDYNSSFLAGDTANHAVMAKMTQEELNNVFLFLIDLKRD